MVCDMNIFAIDLKPSVCASCHTDRHIIKMPLETAQMLSFVYYHADYWNKPIPNLLMGYSKAHDKHPCSLWIRESKENFIWTCELGIQLVQEYRFRYDSVKHQRCLDIFNWCLDNIPDLKSIGLTPFALAMPDTYKSINDVESYRSYYRFGKTDLHKWTKREKPVWI
jgi:hypothetical protein